MLQKFIEKINAGSQLSRQEAYSAIELLLASAEDKQQASDFLLALNSRLPVCAEMNGYLDYLSEKSISCELNCTDHFDLCGTGGDGKNTINISTLSSFLLSAMGEKVAKHGNYAASSSVGSSNLLEALSVPLCTSVEDARRCFLQSGIVFLHAPYWHPALKVIAPIRKELGVRTVFNLMGPLLNPTKPVFQLVGTPSNSVAALLAEVLTSRNAAGRFVTIADHAGYDEVSLTAKVSIFSPKDNADISERVLDFADFEAAELTANSIKGQDDIYKVTETAEKILAGHGTQSQQSVICANVALALQLKYPTQKLSDLYAKAINVLESGAAMEVLQVLRSFK